MTETIGGKPLEDHPFYERFGYIAILLEHARARRETQGEGCQAGSPPCDIDGDVEECCGYCQLVFARDDLLRMQKRYRDRVLPPELDLDQPGSHRPTV